MSQDDISSRKADHIELCLDDAVEFRSKSTLLEQVELLHDSLPELSLSEIDLSTPFLGRTLGAPLLITGMTGGADAASSINRELARVAQELGIIFGLGSQRAILKDPALLETYQVRDVAPDVPILGNIGAVQAAEMSTQELEDLVGLDDANALCIHLNPGQELMQPEGDRSFVGCVDAIGRLVGDLSIPVIVKETGCGLSLKTLARLSQTEVEWVDVSGAGGTTWIGVETLRTPPAERSLGELLWEWGTPTAASIVWAKRRGYSVMGTGGLRNGMDVARALALGASIAGMARPWLVAVHEGGFDQALSYGHNLLHALRAILLLTGSGNIAQLQSSPRVIGPKLKNWLAQDPLAS